VVKAVLPGPRVSLLLVLLATALTRLIWLGRPDRVLIFDEAYYVNAARRMLGWPVPAGAPYADALPGIDPNLEHPPLGKVIIAGSMRVFGDTPTGWRLPAVVAGVVVVAAVYLLVRAAGREPELGVYAAAATALDNLLFVHSRIATLDVLFVAALMIGAVLALRSHWCWAGVACGVAANIKLPATFGLAALLLMALCQPAATRAARLGRAVAFAAPALVVWVGGLWLLDAVFTTFDSPFAHLRHMLSYGLDLSRAGGPANSESDPWQWLSNETQISYFRVDTDVSIGGQVVTTQPLVWFRGAMNPALVGLALPGVAYAGWRWRRWNDWLACWVVLWVSALFLPFLVLRLVAHRISYLFYALPLVPSFAVASALLLWHEGLPRICRWGFAMSLVLGFVAYFPFRSMFGT